MRKKLVIMFSLLLVTFLFVTICFADNPIFKNIYTADPAPMVYNGRVYLYTGHDENNATTSYLMKDWRCYSSTDMVNWTDHGAVLSVTAFSWAGQTKDANAAQVIYRNGKFYYFVSVAGPGGIAIGVGVSTSPTGPFTDALGKPLVTYSMTNFSGYATHTWRNLDPTVFIDDDGQAYLYWGNNALYWAKLNSDMISLNGSINYFQLTTAAFGQDYEEAPWLYKRNGLYYLMYAAGFPEWIAYSTSSSPTGPWTYRGVIMNKGGGSGTIHPGVIDFNGSSYFFYHNAWLPGGNDYHRSVCIERFKYNADGTIPLINMTTAGVGTPGPTMNPTPTPTPTPTSGPRSAFSQIEAESYNTQSGIQTESCGEGGQNIGYIENGDYVVYNNIDFGSGAASFQARVASGTSGGNIEIRLDSTGGTLVGTCSVAGTGDWQTWTTSTCSVSGTSGTHNLYLIFTGGSGYLFNLNWFQFIRESVTPTPSATTTPTPVLTPTPVVTLSPTVTPTPVRTATPRRTATPGRTATPRRTATPGRTATPRITPTPVVIATPSPVVTTTPSPTATPSPTETPLPTGGIKVQFYNQSTAATTNQVYLNIQLVNTGTGAIALSDVKIRYYYMADGTQPQTFYCDYSPVGSSNVTGSFVTMAAAKTGADTYVEVGFSSSEGSIAAGGNTTIQARFAKNDWSNYIQSNDYSFNSSASSYVDWTKVTGYVSGALTWGTEP